MRLVYKIFFCSMFLSACANNASDSQGVNSATISEDMVQNLVDSLENEVKSNAALQADEDIQDPAENSIPKVDSKLEAEEIRSASDNDDDSKPRTRSTIAQQQEAARRIQNELENRSPKPDEEEVQKGAVFQKVVSKPSEKKKPIPVSTKKKASAKKSTSNKAKPAIVFEEMKMTFDTIAQGDIIDHKFVFTNTGNAPLEIKAASATCGCTQPSFPFIPIEPNEQGHITVRYNSVGKEGFQNPEITIKTNVDKNEITLFMEGVVVKESEEVEEGK